MGRDCGTYSSIFVASAILMALGVKRDWSNQIMKWHTGSAGVNHMRLNEINYTDVLPIDGYGPGFRVGGQVYNSVLCSGAGVGEWGVK